MKIEFYSFKRKAEASKKMRVEKDDGVHWVIVFPEYKKSYCSLCLYENCLHGQSYINPNMGSIFMEHLDFKKRHEVEIETTEDNIMLLGITLMTFLSQNPAMRKDRLLKLIEKNV